MRDSSGSLSTVDVGFAIDEVVNGGWYGIAPTLTGLSSSRKYLNSGCENHLVYVYQDAHMISSLALGSGWRANASGCTISGSSIEATWIGVR